MKSFLSDDEFDLVVELVNIGVGKSAASLSQIAGEEVLLCVPILEFLTLDDATHVFEERLPSSLTGVSQEFSGFFSGKAALLFPESRSLDLVNVMLGGDDFDGEVDVELEEEALSELGNILLNNCLSTISNILNKPLATLLPQTFHTQPARLVNQLVPKESDETVIMLLKIDFYLKSRNLSGHVVFVIDFTENGSFKDTLQDYLRSIEEL
jgi:chemotaxis protein CheC